MTPVPSPRKARQETGGPSRSAGLAVGGQAAAPDVEAQIIGLETLTIGELRIEWQRLYRATPPTRLSRDLLLRGLAYRVQEGALGGLSLRTKRRLRSLAGQGGDPRNAAASKLRPGTKLVREWHQRVHTVSVLEGGFEYQGERYASLSRIARRITGVTWSGPRFFGISMAPRRTHE